MGKDAAINMAQAGLDQDWAAKVDGYDKLSPRDRGELAQCLLCQDGYNTAPAWVAMWVVSLAQTAFLETALRWSKQNDETCASE